MKPTKRLQKKIDKCKSVYLIGCWAHFGVQKYAWTGKFVEYHGHFMPEVWYYNDHNGEFEEWYKVPLYYVTTGTCFSWSFDENVAHKIADALEEYYEHIGR